MAKAIVQQHVSGHDQWHPSFADHDARGRSRAPASTPDRPPTGRADLAALAAAGVSYLMLVERAPRLGPCRVCRPLVGRTCRIGDPLITAAIDCTAGCLSLAPLYLE